MPGNHNDIEKRPRDLTDKLRASSRPTVSEYSRPVLALISFSYAYQRFSEGEKIRAGAMISRGKLSKSDSQALGILHLPGLVIAKI
jgi:type I restriction enzyme M protein